MRLPGFNAGTSLGKASNFVVAAAPSHWGAGVVPADSQTCNCNCAGGAGGSTTDGPPPPGICACSSILGIGCSTSSNSCNPGYVPQCNCGVIGNSCQCVPSAQ